MYISHFGFICKNQLFEVYLLNKFKANKENSGLKMQLAPQHNGSGVKPKLRGQPLSNGPKRAYGHLTSRSTSIGVTRRPLIPIPADRTQRNQEMRRYLYIPLGFSKTVLILGNFKKDLDTPTSKPPNNSPNKRPINEKIASKFFRFGLLVKNIFFALVDKLAQWHNKSILSPIFLAIFQHHCKEKW